MLIVHGDAVRADPAASHGARTPVGIGRRRILHTVRQPLDPTPQGRPGLVARQTLWGGVHGVRRAGEVVDHGRTGLEDRGRPGAGPLGQDVSDERSHWHAEVARGGPDRLHRVDQAGPGHGQLVGRVGIVLVDVVGAPLHEADDGLVARLDQGLVGVRHVN